MKSIQELKSKLALKEEMLKNVQKDYAAYRESTKDLRDDIQKFREGQDEMTELCKRCEDKVIELEGKNESLSMLKDKYHIRLLSQEKDLRALRENMKKLGSEVEAVQSEKNALYNQIKELQDKLEAKTALNVKMRDDIETLEAKVHDDKEIIDALQHSKQIIEKDFMDAKQKIAEITTYDNKLNNDIRQLKKQNKAEMIQLKINQKEYVSNLTMGFEKSKTKIHHEYKTSLRASDTVIVELRKKLQIKETHLDEMGQAQTAKNEMMAKMVNDLNKKNEYEQESRQTQLKHIHLSIEDYLIQLQSGSPKYLMMRSSKTKKSKVINTLQKIQQDINVDKRC